MPKFACWFYLTDVLKDAELEWQRYVDLPFAPRKGDHFSVATEDLEGSDFCPHLVDYCIPDDTFHCHGRELRSGGCPCNEADDCCTANQRHKDWQIAGGWILADERRGKDRHFKFAGMFGEADKYAAEIKD